MAKIGRPKKFSKRLRIPNFKVEERLWHTGCHFIAGVDEVGRGAWAGPLYAAAVILPKKRIYQIRDSKLLPAKERLRLAEKVKDQAIDFAFGRVRVAEMVELGMLQATLLAFKRALRKLKNLDYILTDYYPLQFLDCPNKNIVKGDQECLSVASASIVAKVERDRVMTQLSEKYSQYRFEQNKGYPSPDHQQALKELGPCPIHRPNFAPVKRLLSL